MDKALCRAFGRRVRALRTQRGLSQEKFAELCGLHRTYMGGIERGERNISLINIGRIAKALKMPLAELFGSDDFNAQATDEPS
jgi:transcriptional regulator with XRE-family HTH domain